MKGSHSDTQVCKPRPGRSEESLVNMDHAAKYTSFVRASAQTIVTELEVELHSANFLLWI